MEVIEDAGPIVNGSVSHVHQHVCEGEGGEGEVAGAVAGVPAHDDLEPGFLEAEGELRSPALEPLRKLEGDPSRPPFTEIFDQLREIFQRYAPGS